MYDTEEPGWELFRTFLEVARDGSLSGAARKLALTQPTVGRHIDALEAALGLSLFSRSPQGLTATPAALELVGYAEAMAAASAALRRTASSGAQTDRGTVRITASEMIGCEVLPPMLASFRDSHPGIVLELALSNRNEDLLRRDADIAVRMVRPRQKSLLARRIGKTAIGFYAHRDYLKGYGVPKTHRRLREALLDRLRSGRSGRFGAWARCRRRLPATILVFAATAILHNSRRCGRAVGIGGCQHNIARRFQELVPVLGKAIRFELEVWIAMHEDMKSTSPVRMLFDHLAAGLSAFVRGNSSPIRPAEPS